MTLLQHLLRGEPRCQSTAVALLLLCNSAVGAVAPWAVGTWFDDGTAASLRTGLLVVLGGSYGASCFCFVQLAHELRRTVRHPRSILVLYIYYLFSFLNVKAVGS
jgi:hypothetical protein